MHIFKSFRFLFLIAIVSVILTACEKEIDSYYKRPDWKELSIYKVLESEGRFSSYLQCVDRTEYAGILDGAGLFTVFAPNDEAFAQWLSIHHYGSVDKIPLDTLRRIVAFSIVSGKWNSAHLTDKVVANAFVPGAFKRKSVYYTMPYQDPEFNNEWVYDEPIEGSYESTIKEYQTLLTKQNYKYVPVFTSQFFSLLSLNAENDYKTFYPNADFTGMNVGRGAILGDGMLGENGIIHEVSTVNEPDKNIHEILKEPQFSGYKGLLDFQPTPDHYVFKRYSEVPNDLLQTFQLMMPGKDVKRIYLKSYSNNPTAKLSFSPLADNIKGEDGYDSESLGNTVFVPANDVLENYIQDKLLKYYSSLEQLPVEVIATLINTHMVKELVWPSYYQRTKNSTGEYLNGEGATGKNFPDAGVLTANLASNGFVYQIDHIIKSRFFETVYAEILLNPAHIWLNTAYVKFFASGLREDLMKSILNDDPNQRFTVLNFSDEQLQNDGFTYDGETNTFNNSIGGAETRLKRLMQLHVFPGNLNVQTSTGVIDTEIKTFDDLPKILQYENWSFLTSLSGDMIRYKNGLGLQAAGNIEDGTYTNLVKVEGEFNNGQVYNVDKMLEYAPRESVQGTLYENALWTYIDRARTENPNVKTFVDYIEKCLKSADGNSLSGISTEGFYTILMPNNTAMTQAINKGDIMPLDSISPNNVEYLAQATKFVNAHILAGRVFPDDGLPYLYPISVDSPDSIPVSTLLKITDEDWGLVNQSTLISVKKNPSGIMILTPLNIRSAGMVAVAGEAGINTAVRIQRGKPVGSPYPNSYRSNRIASKAVIHEINNYFKFTVSERE